MKRQKARTAKIVGFQGLKTYRKTKEVCSYGIPELLLESIDLLLGLGLNSTGA